MRRGLFYLLSVISGVAGYATARYFDLGPEIPLGFLGGVVFMWLLGCEAKHTRPSYPDPPPPPESRWQQRLKELQQLQEEEAQRRKAREASTDNPPRP